MKIAFRNIKKNYGEAIAIKELSLEIADGELHFLLGPSGCGKTTALRILAGLEPPTAGQIFFADRDVTHLRAVERNVGMVFQNYALWPHMTVYKNIAYGLKIKKRSRAYIEQRVQEVLDLTQLQKFADRLPGQLSGGQQQRVALARALATTPNVLLLDEPLSNLDAKLRLEMRANLSEIHRRTKITTVYVTHDQKEALSMGTRITVMRAGQVCQTGSPKELYDHPADAFLAGFIGETNLLPAKIAETRADGWLRLECPLGQLNSRNNRGDTLTAGDKVLLSIRPEAIKVFRPSTDNQNKFTMLVDHLTYLGESEQLSLTPTTGDSDLQLKATLFNVSHLDIEVGKESDFYVDPHDLQVLPDMSNLDSET